MSIPMTPNGVSPLAHLKCVLHLVGIRNSASKAMGGAKQLELAVHARV